MKLAFCLFKYFPFGGLQRDFLRIAKECVRRGHAVDVYTMEWEGDLDPELSVKVIATRGWQNHTRSRNFVTHVQADLVKQRYDLVVGFNKMPGLDIYYAADSCFQAKARTQHGVWDRLMPRYRHLISYESAVFSKKMNTQILLISAAEQAEFMRYYHTAPTRFHLLPPGITGDRIAPANADKIRLAVRHAHHIEDNTFLLLLVGSGFKTKGLDRALLSLAALPEHLKKRTKLYVIGQDNPRIFQQQARHLNIAAHVTFLGGRDDVPQLMLAADVLLHPAYRENTGTVLLEAVIAGLPVLTTDVCGYAHYIHQAKAGVILSSPFQQQEFNQTLMDMLSSPERSTWHHNGLAFAKNADIYSMPERAADVIEALHVNA